MDGRVARRHENHARIVSAARRIIERSGLDGLSMRLLAEEAGVSVATLYNLFQTRAAILQAALAQALDEFEPVFTEVHPVASLPELRDVVADVGTMVLTSLTAPVTRAVMTDPGTAGLFVVGAREEGHLSAELAAATARGDLAGDVPTRQLLESLDAVLAAAARLWSLELIDVADCRRRIRDGVEVVLLADATASGRRALLEGSRRRPVLGRARRAG